MNFKTAEQCDTAQCWEAEQEREVFPADANGHRDKKVGLQSFLKTANHVTNRYGKWVLRAMLQKKTKTLGTAGPSHTWRSETSLDPHPTPPEGQSDPVYFPLDQPFIWLYFSKLSM